MIDIQHIEPCPTCGKKDEIQTGQRSVGRFFIECYRCHVNVYDDRKEKAQAHWNAIKRSSDIGGPNNGWNRIDGPDSLPEPGSYLVLNKEGKIEEYSYSGHYRSRNVWLEYFTHWREKFEIPKPIY